MSGPKAEAILARSTDPAIKKRKKKPKNEDYVTKLENGDGLRMRDEDEWRGKGTEDVEMGDGDDAPSMYTLICGWKGGVADW
jgi:pre-mRNA-splicing factor CWC26